MISISKLSMTLLSLSASKAMLALHVMFVASLFSSKAAELSAPAELSAHVLDSEASFTTANLPTSSMNASFLGSETNSTLLGAWPPPRDWPFTVFQAIHRFPRAEPHLPSFRGARLWFHRPGPECRDSGQQSTFNAAYAAFIADWPQPLTYSALRYHLNSPELSSVVHLAFFGSSNLLASSKGTALWELANEAAEWLGTIEQHNGCRSSDVDLTAVAMNGQPKTLGTFRISLQQAALSASDSH